MEKLLRVGNKVGGGARATSAPAFRSLRSVNFTVVTCAETTLMWINSKGGELAGLAARRIAQQRVVRQPRLGIKYGCSSGSTCASSYELHSDCG